MTHHETRLKQAYAASGMALLGISFAKACREPMLRMSLEGWVKAQDKTGKPAPVQPALI